MRDRPLILGTLALMLVILTAPFWHGALAYTGNVAPVIPPAKGPHCVRPRQWMIRNHMKLLMQLRYEAVHEGIRHKAESLPGCISCHVSRLPDGKYPSVTSRKFFCTACHDYVGVRIDCFSCHTNRPYGADQAARQTSDPLSGAREAKRGGERPGRGGRGSSAVSTGREMPWRSARWRSP